MKVKSIKNGFLTICTFALLSGCATQHTAETEKFAEKTKTDNPIQSLGNNQYKIGNILINKSDRSFEVTGKFLRLEPPIEFLAVAKDGQRGYESLLELDVDVFQFNLACILIGLDKNKGEPPKFHFDSDPIEGDSVEVWVSWKSKEKSYRVEAANLFKFKDAKLKSGEWVYTGSSFTPGEHGGYMPELNGGTLIGIVHDPASIIEHRFGFGAGSFSELILDPSLSLTVDMQITIQVKHIGKSIN